MENAKPMRHAPRKVPIHLQDAFHSEIRNLKKLGILEETKDVTEWGEQLCDHGEEDSSQLQQVSSHLQQSRTLQGQEKVANLPGS